MRARRYIKDIILEYMGPEGCYAKDLAGKVSERLGMPFSKQRASSYLALMFMSDEVQREPEIAAGALRRYKWFKSD